MNSVSATDSGMGDETLAVSEIAPYTLIHYSLH